MIVEQRIAGLCIFVAVGICLFSVTLASCVLRRGDHRLTYVPPAVKCFVSGLLLGLGLLVMLPSALQQAPANQLSAHHVLLMFVSSAAAMFVIHHVFMSHSHNHGEAIMKPESVAGPLEAAGLQEPCSDDAPCNGSDIENCVCGTPARVSGLGKPTHCPPVGIPSVKKQPTDEPPAPSRGPLVLTTAVPVLLRALPYTIHAFIDGAVLGTAQSLMVLLSLAIPITLCSVQDVGTIIVNLSANGASRSVTLITVLCFGMGFPLGTAATVALTSRTGEGAAAGLAPLRACAAGVFAYMALFELAPPHAHGRVANLRYAIAFASGIALVLLSEQAEDWAVSTIFAAGEVHGPSLRASSSNMTEAWLEQRAAPDAASSSAAANVLLPSVPSEMHGS